MMRTFSGSRGKRYIDVIQCTRAAYTTFKTGRGSLILSLRLHGLMKQGSSTLFKGSAAVVVRTGFVISIDIYILSFTDTERRIHKRSLAGFSIFSLMPRLMKEPGGHGQEHDLL